MTTPTTTLRRRQPSPTQPGTRRSMGAARFGAILCRFAYACAFASFALFTAACSDAFEQSGPSDIVLSGTLCVPGDDSCPSNAVLRRGSQVGANQLDFRLQNMGAAAEFQVVATIDAAAQPDAGLSDVSPLAAAAADAGDTALPSPTDPVPEPIILVARAYQLGAGESVADRFVARELLTHATKELTKSCAPCHGTLDYTLAADALECRSDDDCSGTWACSRSDGRCVECLKNADCSASQSCDLATQTCTPPDTGGCATSVPPGGPPLGLAGLVVGLFVGLIALRRRRRGPLAAGSPHSLVGMLFTVMLLATYAAPLQAAPPSAALQLGLGPRVLTGKLAEDTQRGIGLSVAQEVRGRYVGGRVSLGTSYYLTTQPAPPLSRELQLYSVAIGPQFYLPLEPVEISLGADVRHVGIVTNSLARLTGPSLNFASAGATVQVRQQFSSFLVMLDAGYHPIFGLSSALLSVNLSLGLATD